MVIAVLIFRHKTNDLNEQIVRPTSPSVLYKRQYFCKLFKKFQRPFLYLIQYLNIWVQGKGTRNTV